MKRLVCQAKQRQCHQRLHPSRRWQKSPSRLPIDPASARRISSGFTLIELLIVIAIIALLISILVPALSRSREVARRTICGSNMRQFGIAMLQYAQDSESWLPAKAFPREPGKPVWELATAQQRASTEYGPNFSGIVRDVIERRHTRETAAQDGATAPPQYLPDPKVLLCASDKLNNPPNEIPGSYSPLPDGQLLPTAAVLRYSDLPRTARQETDMKKSFNSYIYIALWRNDDRGDFLLMADQSNHNDTTTFSFTYLTPEDNHGTRGLNVLLLDSHVEWSPAASGNFKDLQHLSNRYWGPIIATRKRYAETPEGSGRNAEVQTIE